ncbi:MAG: hypothetical protein JWL76_2267 [Thermoleophilia bacterium]|nr:hypothetical protein [Thermoleophilia bacterium]
MTSSPDPCSSLDIAFSTDMRVSLEISPTRTIEYEVVVSERRRTLTIEVHPDASIVVRAPTTTTPEEIQLRVTNRLRWIRKQLEHFREFGIEPLPRSYVRGECHRYLGKQYRLTLAQGRQSVRIEGDRLRVVCIRPSDPACVEQALHQWYLSRAREEFERRIDSAFHDFEMRGFQRPTLIVRRMRRRWGSHSPSNRITLNLDLIRAPRRCIDYVIVHELCHLADRSHGEEFTRLLGVLMPDWQDRKRALEAQDWSSQ